MYLAIQILLVLIVILGSILTWKLFTLPKRTRFIALYTLFISLIALNQILSYYNATIEIFPIFNTFIGYFLSPLLFFHCISLFKIKSLKKLVNQHFLASIPILCSIIYWIFDDYRRKLLGYNSNSYVTILHGIQYLVYLVLLIQFLSKRKDSILGIRPALQYKRIHFSIQLFLVQGILTATILFENFTAYANATEYLVFFIFLVALGQLLSILFMQKKYPTFFGESNTLFQLAKKGNVETEVYRSESTVAILQELEELMANQKIYKDSTLTIKRLADQLRIAEHKLSKILKETYHLTYTEYMSFQRLEEAKKLLKQSRNNDARINEIMYDVGFNSKLAFNNWFKKNTGFTPTEFKKGSD